MQAQLQIMIDIKVGPELEHSPIVFLDALASLELVMTVTEDFFREIFSQSVNKTF